MQEQQQINDTSYFDDQKFIVEEGNYIDEAQFDHTDQKHIVTNFQVHPFNALGKILARNTYLVNNLVKQNIKNGIGCLIHPNVVLTAAHVVYFQESTQNSGWSKDVQFSLFRDKKSLNVKQCLFNQNYADKNNKNFFYDVAILILQQNAAIKDEQVLHLNSKPNFSTKIPKYIKIITVKSNQYNKNQIVYEQSNKIERFYQDKLFYKHTTNFGDSGTPILMSLFDDFYCVVGIHKGSNHFYNFGICVQQIMKHNPFFSNILQSYNLDLIAQIVEPQSEIKVVDKKIQKQIKIKQTKQQIQGKASKNKQQKKVVQKQQSVTKISKQQALIRQKQINDLKQKSRHRLLNLWLADLISIEQVIQNNQNQFQNQKIQQKQQIINFIDIFNNKHSLQGNSPQKSNQKQQNLLNPNIFVKKYQNLIKYVDQDIYNDDVQQIRFSDDFILDSEEFYKYNWKGLVKVDLSKSIKSDKQLNKFMQNGDHMPTLQKLKIFGIYSNFYYYEIFSFQNFLQNFKKLVSLDLSITNLNARTIGFDFSQLYKHSALNLSSLKQLNLEGNLISKRGLNHIFRSKIIESVQKFSLSKCSMGSNEMQFISENGHKLKNLRELNLSHNIIRNQGLRLFEPRQNTFKLLILLDLCNIFITNEGWKFLVKSAQYLESLKVLYLQSNIITTVETGDMEHFKNLSNIFFGDDDFDDDDGPKHHLDIKSLEILKKYQNQHPNIKIHPRHKQQQQNCCIF